MPFYDFRCEECDKLVEDEFFKLADEKKIECCGIQMKQAFLKAPGLSDPGGIGQISKQHRVVVNQHHISSQMVFLTYHYLYTSDNVLWKIDLIRQELPAEHELGLMYSSSAMGWEHAQQSARHSHKPDTSLVIS